jgi:hypothetical protein
MPRTDAPRSALDVGHEQRAEPLLTCAGAFLCTIITYIHIGPESNIDQRFKRWGVFVA